MPRASVRQSPKVIFREVDGDGMGSTAKRGLNSVMQSLEKQKKYQKGGHVRTTTTRFELVLPKETDNDDDSSLSR